MKISSLISFPAFRVKTPWLRRRCQAVSGLRAGFSLVEVAIALGIFGFAIIPIIGIMGVGLNVSKDSIDTSTMAQIFRAAEAYASSETNDSVLAGKNLYFTHYGEQLSNGSQTRSDGKMVVHQVNFAMNAPSDAAQGLLARRLVKVSIVKAAAPGVINGVRFFQISRDPAELRSYFP
jgi:uncharacterized protein (TIGR02598 family)